MYIAWVEILSSYACLRNKKIYDMHIQYNCDLNLFLKIVVN